MDNLDLSFADIGLGDIDLDLSAFDLAETANTENRYVKPKLHHAIKATAVKYDRAGETLRAFCIPHDHPAQRVSLYVRTITHGQQRHAGKRFSRI